jgi:hypothetical protein
MQQSQRSAPHTPGRNEPRSAAMSDVPSPRGRCVRNVDPGRFDNMSSPVGNSVGSFSQQLPTYWMPLKWPPSVNWNSPSYPPEMTALTRTWRPAHGSYGSQWKAIAPANPRWMPPPTLRPTVLGERVVGMPLHSRASDGPARGGAAVRGAGTAVGAGLGDAGARVARRGRTADVGASDRATAAAAGGGTVSDEMRARRPGDSRWTASRSPTRRARRPW